VAPSSLPAANTVPESPYTGTVRSGTSSTYWYSSVGSPPGAITAAGFAASSATASTSVRESDPRSSTRVLAGGSAGAYAPAGAPLAYSSKSRRTRGEPGGDANAACDSATDSPTACSCVE
jgi:hypothetical protein